MSDHHTHISLTFLKLDPHREHMRVTILVKTVRLQDPVEVVLRLAIYMCTALAKSSTSDVHK